MYYRIVEKEFNGKKYYTLFGYDENDDRTTKKWLDVMWFDENEKPVFGKQGAFSFAQDSLPKPASNRFLLEYKKDGRARVQYDEEMDMIIFDHLVSETSEPGKKYTLIPDGDYEGFKWQYGQWQHSDKVFNFKLEDGQAPVPEAIDFNNRLLKGEIIEEAPPTAPKQQPQKKPVAKPPVKKKTGN